MLFRVITLDDNSWPLLVISFSGNYGDAAFRAYLDQYEQYLARGERYAVVFVTEPKARMMGSNQAKWQAEWIREREGQLKQRLVGLGFVLPSVVMRGALRAILWMQPMPARHKVFSTVAEAVEWTSRKLAAEGIHAPPYRAHG